MVGSHDEDKLFAEALRRAAGRFGSKILQERVFEDRGGARRTDSGIVQVQRQIPVFTQQAPAYVGYVRARQPDNSDTASSRRGPAGDDSVVCTEIAHRSKRLATVAAPRVNRRPFYG